MFKRFLLLVLIKKKKSELFCLLFILFWISNYYLERKYIEYVHNKLGIYSQNNVKTCQSGLHVRSSALPLLVKALLLLMYSFYGSGSHLVTYFGVSLSERERWELWFWQYLQHHF